MGLPQYCCLLGFVFFVQLLLPSRSCRIPQLDEEHEACSFSTAAAALQVVLVGVSATAPLRLWLQSTREDQLGVDGERRSTIAAAEIDADGGDVGLESEIKEEDQETDWVRIEGELVYLACSRRRSESLGVAGDQRCDVDWYELGLGWREIDSSIGWHWRVKEREGMPELLLHVAIGLQRRRTRRRQ